MLRRVGWGAIALVACTRPNAEHSTSSQPPPAAVATAAVVVEAAAPLAGSVEASESACAVAVQALVDQTDEAKKATRSIEEGAKKSRVPAGVGGYTMPPSAPGAGWDVAICESYTDRMPCYHHFDVNPATAAVVYSSGGDDRPITTDPTLAAKVRAACR